MTGPGGDAAETGGVGGGDPGVPPAGLPGAGEDRPRWTIGDVARLSRLTVTALRHYHDEGLLLPDHVDPLTGYRYYGDGQVTQALRLGLLRQLGIPLADLRRLADGRATLEELLAATRRRLLAEMRARRRALELLDALTTSGAEDRPASAAATGLEAAVTERVLEPCVVDSLRVAAGWDRLTEATRYGLARLAVAQRRAGSPVGEEPGALFPLAPVDRFELRVFRRAGSVTPPGTETCILPGGRVLEVLHVGGHALLPHAYRTLLAEVARRGLEAVGPVRETYLPARAGPSRDGQPVTRLLVPVDGRRG